MRELGINLWVKDPAAVPELLDLIAGAGFDLTFPTVRTGSPLGQWRREAEKRGLRMESVHFPFGKMNDLWLAEEAGAAFLAELKDLVDLSVSQGMRLAVVHTSIHTPPVPVTDLGKGRFAALCDYAEKRRLHLAFENLEPQQTLAAVLDGASPFHGFCWDSGHNACYTPQEDVTGRFGDRLMFVHLNDNRGVSRPGEIHFRDDLHLIPGDGILDWDWVTEKLRGMPAVPVTLELKAPAGAEAGSPPDRSVLRPFFERAFRVASSLRDKIG